MRYHWLSALSVIAIAPFASLTTPVSHPWDDIHVKHAWNTVPTNWESLGPPPPGTTIDFYVVLKPHVENALVDALYEVSSPGNPKYGAHLSKEDVARLVAPHPNTLELIHSWLKHHGVPSSSILTTYSDGWLTLTGVPVSQANQLLGASYEVYRHAGTNESTILRTISYALPAVLHSHVQTVAPTTYFTSIRTLPQTARRPSVGATVALAKVGSRGPETVTPRGPDMANVVTPEFLRWLYKTFAYEPTAIGRNKLGIVGLGDEYPSSTDLTAFMSIFRKDAVAATFTVEYVNDGGYDETNPGEEANLNVQYAQAIAYPTPHIFYSTGGRFLWTLSSGKPAPGDAMLTLLNYLLNQTNIPQTISISYGVEEMAVPLEYATAVCNKFSELGARGVSVLFASGDNGVGAGKCKVKDGSGRLRVQFRPMFPASCPYVTSVGGTTSHLPETAANLSGGGFSNYFPRPPYQNDAVPPFLKSLGRKYNGLYNASGRGIPDIAAQAVDFLIAIEDEAHLIVGTSCATPTAAGIISLLNDFLISNGKPPLGFLNPWLYGNGLDGLNDITSGSNPGCRTKGFFSVDGWDPVTGLGTLDFFELQHVLWRTEGIDKQKGIQFSEPLLVENNSSPTR